MKWLTWCSGNSFYLKIQLSVVTVFDDDMGTYLPRQLIAEKIKSASDKIPAGFGTPRWGHHYRSWRNLSIHFGGRT
jgi:hypothetical protein